MLARGARGSRGWIDLSFRPSWTGLAATAGLAFLIAWLGTLGRPFFCPCGTNRLWGPAEDSQQLADWYSLLHVTFGLGLCVLVDRFQPRWPLSLKALAVLFSSIAWEAVENLPGVIALFDTPGVGRPYSGDTILNALGDTGFVMLGAALAARLPGPAVLLLAAAIEIVVGGAIGDGLLIGTARLLA
jgi:hypothetical protein